jgi:hypothetical protein
MATHKELLRLNHDIEVLENAGLIKAASILHKKFIKEAQAVPGASSYVTNAGNEVIKPGQTAPPTAPPTNKDIKPPYTGAPPPTATPPAAPPPSPFGNYFQDPSTGKIIFVDPGTGRPYENGQGLPSDLGQGGNFTPPPGFTVTPAPMPVPTPAPNPFPTPGNSDIPDLRERFNFYYGQINNGFSIGDPQQQQAYFDRVKRQIFDQLQKGLIDQKTYGDLMKLFAR